MIKDNGDGSWTMGKPGTDRISTFKLNTQFEETWGKVSTSNLCKMEGNTLIRETEVKEQNVKMTVKAEPNEGGVLLTHICGDVVATRSFVKV